MLALTQWISKSLQILSHSRFLGLKKSAISEIRHVKDTPLLFSTQSVKAKWPSTFTIDRSHWKRQKISWNRYQKDILWGLCAFWECFKCIFLNWLVFQSSVYFSFFGLFKGRILSRFRLSDLWFLGLWFLVVWLWDWNQF